MDFIQLFSGLLFRTVGIGGILFALILFLIRILGTEEIIIILILEQRRRIELELLFSFLVNTFD